MIEWKNITIKQYYDICSVRKKEGTLSLTDIVHVLSIVQKKSIEEFKAAPLKQIKNEIRKLEAIFSSPPNFKSLMHFEYEGHKYYIKDLSEDTFNAYASFEMVLSRYKSTDINQITYSLGILARRLDEAFEDYDLDDRAKHFENLPVEVALGVAGFFLDLEQSLQKLTGLSTQIEEKLEALQIPQKGLYKKTFSKNGDGLVLPSPQLMGLLVLMKLRANLQKRYYNFCHSLRTKLNWKKILQILKNKK